MIGYITGGLGIGCLMMAALWQLESYQHDKTKDRLAKTEIAKALAENAVDTLQKLSDQNAVLLAERERKIDETNKITVSLQAQIRRERATTAREALAKPFDIGNDQRSSIARILCITPCGSGDSAITTRADISAPAKPANDGNTARPDPNG